MKPRLKSSHAARALIMAHEPFYAEAARSSDDRWVVGYGHRAAARDGVSVSQDDAALLLVYDVLQAEKVIDEVINAEIGTNQRDALVSFALGIGLSAFRNSAVVRLINKGRWREAGNAIASWNGGQADRHVAERALFEQDLPEDANREPIELVIEFDHPDDDEVVPVQEAANHPEDEPSTALVQDTSPSSEEQPEEDVETNEEPHLDAPEATEDVNEDAPNVEEAQADTLSPSLGILASRSPLAEQVITRMRLQLSGTVRSTGYEGSPDSETDTPSKVETIENAVAEDTPVEDMRLGFSFTQSQAFDPEAPVQDSTLPPVQGQIATATNGLVGEATGSGSASSSQENVEDHSASKEIPAPEEILGEFVEAEEVESEQIGWANGDVSVAKGKRRTILGEPMVMTLGAVLLAAGGWDSYANAGNYLSGRDWPLGPLAALVGFIFFVGAAYSLIFGDKKRSS